jgi:hypothetical protein
MIAALTAVLLASAVPACVPVKDAETLWASQNTRWIFVGEYHGTNEIPDAFVNLVCLAAKKRGPVTVAVEYPSDMQPVLDTWMASDGGDEAKAAFLAAPYWQRKFQDGRTSTAFLRMFERLRLLHGVGQVVALRAFDSPYDGSDKRDRNAAMASRLTDIAGATKGLTLVLVGNVHAMRREIAFGTNTVRPAAMLLPEAQRVTVDVNGAGGSAWACTREGCGIQDAGKRPAAPASIVWDKAPDRRFDVTYDLGVPFTAAEPAVPGVADTSAPTRIKIVP